VVHIIDPIRDPRWAELVDRHPASSVFHSKPWLEAIQRTYGYTPVVYTTSAPSTPLSNGVVFCQIKSWLTGRRMVSVPFSDHCDPLFDGPVAAWVIAGELKRAVDSGKWQYVELRPMSNQVDLNGAVKRLVGSLHTLDLRPGLAELSRGFHKDCVTRKIRRAEREGLVYESGTSNRLLNAFYRLMIQTRRKHQLPPQPIEWFRNMAACMGERMQIRVVFKGGREIASIVTLRHKDGIVYKYGCSDTQSQNLGGTPLLFWRTIEEAKLAGLTSMDFGRSDSDNHGLIAFKDRWGAKSSELTYLRWSQRLASAVPTRRSSRAVKKLFAMMPDALLAATGRILYRHVG